MKKLIIHIGSPKCGSSSIQQFFRDNKKPCVQKIRFILLKQENIDQLNHLELKQEVRGAFSKFITKNLSNCNVLLLSHEYLCSRPVAIKNICMIAATKVTETIVIGYSRRQSNFLISAYAQWHFRSPIDIERCQAQIMKMGLNPLFFSGLERHLITLIAKDFYDKKEGRYSVFNWNKSYTAIQELIQPLGVRIEVDRLPDKKTPSTLIEDFCDKTGLNLREKMKNKTVILSNPSFNTELIEAVSNAVLFGIEVSDRHKNNELFQLVSEEMKPTEKLIPVFIATLKKYIDYYYLNSNVKFCRTYGIDEKYFEATVAPSKSQILAVIKEEEQNRQHNPLKIISEQRLVAAYLAEVCIKLAKKTASQTPLYDLLKERLARFLKGIF